MAGELKSLSTRGIRGAFFKRLTERALASWANRFANMFTSDQPVETYKFLGQVPAMRAFRGARNTKSPTPFTLSIANDTFEASVRVDKDDWRRDKVGQILARLNDMAGRAATLPQKTLSAVLEANGNAYDGAALFSDRSSASIVRVNNALSTDITTPSAPSTAEFSAAVALCIDTLMSAKDDQGEPLNEDAMQFDVMVPTKYQGVAAAAVSAAYTSAGVSNPLLSYPAQVRVVTNPRLTAPSSTGVFYVARADAEVKGLIWQDELDTEWEDLVEGSDYAVLNRAYLFATTRIGQGAPGEPGMIARHTFT